MSTEVSIPTYTLKQYSNTVCEAACFFDAIGKMIKRHTAASAHQGHGEPFTAAELEGLAHGFEPVLSELLLVVDELDMRAGKSTTNGE